MYSDGWFPMNLGDAGTQWVQPRDRGLIPLDERFRVPRSLRSKVRSGKFTITSDIALPRVLRGCSAPGRGREDTWLTPDIIEVVELLHRAGHAHSVEAWLPGSPARPGDPGVLVGGLYGVALGAVFCGESMFSLPDLGGTDASKVCLVHLVHHLRRRGFAVLDAQLTNEHLEQFGCYEIPTPAYIELLRGHREHTRSWAPFEPDGTITELHGTAERS